MQSAAERQIEFLRKLQRLLDEGDFSSTYKFALLQALADLAVEHVDAGAGGLALRLDDIAAKFVEYYWRQAAPYRDGVVLRQNNHRQIAVLGDIETRRAVCDGGLTTLRADRATWSSLLGSVSRTVRHMPIEHLQNIGGSKDEFLYRLDEVCDGRLTLLPGVADALRAFHPFVTQLVRGGWVDRIRKIGANATLLGATADLHEFLFGSERESLDGFRDVLRDVQSSRCFYCRTERREGEADHFIPWRRYPVDLGHNFVYACAPCNRAKRDYLAGLTHLERWHDRNIVHSIALTRAFEHKGLAHDVERTARVAKWAYEQAERADAHAWIEKDRFNRVDGAWRDVFEPTLRAAEEAKPYETG